VASPQQQRSPRAGRPEVVFALFECPQGACGARYEGVFEPGRARTLRCERCGSELVATTYARGERSSLDGIQQLPDAA